MHTLVKYMSFAVAVDAVVYPSFTSNTPGAQGTRMAQRSVPLALAIFRHAEISPKQVLVGQKVDFKVGNHITDCDAAVGIWTRFSALPQKPNLEIRSGN